MSFENEYIRKAKSHSAINKWLPALGFLLALAFAGIAFVLSDPVHQFIYEQFFQEDEFARGIAFTSESFDQQSVQYGVAVVLWIIFVMVASFLYAAFAPKPTKLVAESTLKKERRQNEAEKRRAKIRKQELNKAVAREREAQLRADEERSREAAKRKKQG